MSLDDWIPFFEYLTSASAAILAIAFVIFQLRAEHWRFDPLRQPVAITTLTELAAPLFFGLINRSTAESASHALFHHPDDERFVPSNLHEPAPRTLEIAGDPIMFSGSPMFGRRNAITDAD